MPQHHASPGHSLKVRNAGEGNKVAQVKRSPRNLGRLGETVETPPARLLAPSLKFPPRTRWPVCRSMQSAGVDHQRLCATDGRQWMWYENARAATQGGNAAAALAVFHAVMISPSSYPMADAAALHRSRDPARWAQSPFVVGMHPIEHQKLYRPWPGADVTKLPSWCGCNKARSTCAAMAWRIAGKLALQFKGEWQWNL